MSLILIIAATSVNAEPKIHHYDPAKPENAKIAAQNMKADSFKIAAIIGKNETLDSNQLEAIHEITYGLAKSQESLEGSGINAVQMEELENAIKRLHNVSEDHDGAATIKAYQTMQAKLNEGEMAKKLQAIKNLP